MDVEDQSVCHTICFKKITMLELKIKKRTPYSREQQMVDTKDSADSEGFDSLDHADRHPNARTPRTTPSSDDGRSCTNDRWQFLFSFQLEEYGSIFGIRFHRFLDLTTCQQQEQQ